MATSGKDLHATAIVDLQQQGGAALIKTLKEANDLLKKLGQNDSNLHPTMENLRLATRKVVEALNDGTTGTKAFSQELGNIRSILAGISGTKAAIEVLAPGEIAKLKEALALARQLQRLTQTANGNGYTGMKTDMLAARDRQELQRQKEVAAKQREEERKARAEEKRVAAEARAQKKRDDDQTFRESMSTRNAFVDAQARGRKAEADKIQKETDDAAKAARRQSQAAVVESQDMKGQMLALRDRQANEVLKQEAANKRETERKARVEEKRVAAEERAARKREADQSFRESVNMQNSFANARARGQKVEADRLQKEADRAATDAQRANNFGFRDMKSDMYAARDRAALREQREREREEARASVPKPSPKEPGAPKAPAQSAFERGVRSRAELSTGEGAASLLAVQAAIRANSALLTGFTSSIQQAISFSIELEASFRNVQAVIGSTGIEMAGLEKVIKDVSMGTKFSAVEVADAALALGQAGLSAKQIAESIAPVITLANASGSTVAQAVDLVTSIVGVFDKNSSDVTDIANKVTTASNSSKVSVDKLALGFQYAGNTAAQMGISFEEVTAAMAAMSNAGIKSGSTMGTGLRQFLTEVQKPSDNFLDVLKRLGLSISDLDFRSQGFIGVMKTLRESGFVASDAIQSFDVRGAAAFNALLARPEDLQAQYDGLSNSTAAMKANEIQMNSLSAQGARLGNTLGAMASTGFEPVIQALTALIRGVSDALGWLSQFTTVLQVVGVAFAALSGAVVTAWIAPLLVGLARVMGILLGISTAAPTAAGAMGLLQAAATSLTVSFSGLALVSGGVGLAIAAGVAAYVMYNNMVTTTGEQIEILQAKMDKTKGAAQEKSEAITALTNRLELLQQREVQLNSDQAALTTQVNETNEIMVRWGFTINSGTNSLEALRSKIKSVRTELENMRFADMTQVAADANGIYNKRVEDVQEKSRRFSNTSKWARRMASGGSVEGEEEFLNFVSKDPKDSRRIGFAETLKRLRTPEGMQEEYAPQNAQLQSMMQTFAADRNNLSISTRSNFKQYAEDLGEAGRAQMEMRQAKRVKDDAENAVKRTEGSRAYQARLAANGIDPEALGTTRNLAKQAGDELGEKKTDAYALHNATRSLTEVRKTQIASERDRMLQFAVTEDDKRYANEWYTTSIEKAGEGLRSTVEAVKKQLPIDARMSSDPEEESKIRARVSGNKIRPGDVQRYREIQNKKFENEFLAQTVGMAEGAEKESYRVSTRNSARQAIEQFEESVAKAGESAASKALNSQEASYRALIDAKMREAKSFRGRANSNTPVDQLDDLMNKGLEEIAEAKKLELGSISRLHPKGSTEYKNLMAAAEDKYSAAARTFISSFSTLIETATERTYGLTKAFEAFKTQMKQMANKAEEELYKKGAPGRANDLENAINTGPVSGRNRSDVDTYLTNRAREPIDLEFTKAEIASNQQQAADIEANVALLQERMDYATTRFLILQEEKKKLLAGRTEEELTDAEFAKATPIFSELRGLTKELTKSESDMETITNKLQALRNTGNQLRSKEAGLTPTPEAPQTWDSLTVSMDKTWRAYNAFVGTQSVFKTLENGMFSSLQGIGGQIATFFSSVTQGTQTVGQAFRTMAGNIIKSMADVLAQALAMQAVKAILGAFAGVAASGGITAQAVSFGSGAGVAAASSTGLLTSGSAGMGASFSLAGKADGGPIVGGIPGKDSVPIAAMPGEFMIKKTAVDALGMDYMNHLNNTTTRATSSVSTPAVGPALKSAMSSGGGVMNVWVVSPDQMGSNVGPTDIIATITDDVSRGGPIKKLIKSVQMGF